MADNTARAKQFMPFAALRGYYAMVLAKNRVVEPRRELIGDAAERLSRKLARVKKGTIITYCYNWIIRQFFHKISPLMDFYCFQHNKKLSIFKEYSPCRPVANE